MEPPSVLSIDWSSINIWCCGRFFSSVEINQHSIESHSSNNNENSKTVEDRTEIKAMKTLHSCETCKKSFCDKKILDLHLKLHKSGGKVGKELLLQKKNQVPRNNSRNQAKCSFSDKSNLNVHKLSQNVFHKRRTPYRKLAWRPLVNNTKASKSSPIKTRPIEIPSDYMVSTDNELMIAHPMDMSQLNDLEIINKVQPLENSEAQVIYESIQTSKFKTKPKVVKIRNGIFPYNCDSCGKSFLRQHALRIHKKVHNPYSCDACGESFKKNISLYLHMQVNHSQLDSNENVYFKCEICNKEFRQKSFLELHKKLNHEVKLCSKEGRWSRSKRCVKSAVGVVKKERKHSLHKNVVEEDEMDERVQPKEPVTVKEQIKNAFGFDDSTDVEEIDGESFVISPVRKVTEGDAARKVQEKTDAPFRFTIRPSSN